MGYYSKKLTKCEQNYAATELECLAVVCAIEHFAAHLVGRQFMVVTDHQALQYLQSSRHLNGRLTRWALQLQHHNFVIKHRPGKTHQNADGLSRQAWRVEEDQGPEPVLPTAKDGSLSEGGGKCQALAKTTRTITLLFPFMVTSVALSRNFQNSYLSLLWPHL